MGSGQWDSTRGFCYGGASYLRFRLIDHQHATTMTTFDIGADMVGPWAMLKHGCMEGGYHLAHAPTNTQELKTADEATVSYRVPQEHVGFR